MKSLPTSSEEHQKTTVNKDEIALRKSQISRQIMERALKPPTILEYTFDNRIHFRTIKSHILPSACRHEDDVNCSTCRFETQLKLPSLPEMIFDKNRLEIRINNDNGPVFLGFDAFNALSLVDNANLPNVMVDASKEWQKAQGEFPKVSSPFDWTYTSHYNGTLVPNVLVKDTNDQIDMEKLKQPDPLLFYDAIQLYEDELADNGCSEMTVKIRVMPTNFFVLCRFYLRVDRVLLRVYDCRLYSEKGWDYIHRESTLREAPIKNISSQYNSLITDSAQIWQHLPILKTQNTKIYYSTY